MANPHKVRRRKDNAWREGSVHPARRSAPMRHCIFLAAVAAVGVLATAPSARASDTVLLGGIGSSGARSAVDAPAMTLKGLPGTDATVENVHWGYYRPWFRPWWGSGFARPWVGPWWGSGFARPWVGPWWGSGFARPWVGPWWGSGFARPWVGFYRPWFRPWWWGTSFNQPWWGISYASAPTITLGYGAPEFAESISPAVAVTQVSVPAQSPWPPV